MPSSPPNFEAGCINEHVEEVDEMKTEEDTTFSDNSENGSNQKDYPHTSVDNLREQQTQTKAPQNIIFALKKYTFIHKKFAKQKLLTIIGIMKGKV